jgi:hypothetical protein
LPKSCQFNMTFRGNPLVSYLPQRFDANPFWVVT